MMEHFLLALAFFLIIRYVTAQGYCKFPEFLWQPLNDGGVRKWLGKTEYIRNTPTWSFKQDIIVTQTEIIISEKRHASCDSNEIVMTDVSEEGVNCYHNEVVLRLICVARDAGNKYRIQQQGSGKFLFTCMKFKQRSKNVVQIYSAELNEVNEDRLCRDESLQRVEWPWKALIQEKWSACPLVGGFDFKTYVQHRDQILCHRMWRPSRIESECILGEGLDFSFPNERCSPFYNRTMYIHTDCVSSWTENGFTFVMLAETNQPPRYVLRLPQSYDDKGFTAILYFSPIVTVDDEVDIPSGIWNMQLQLKRSESGICYDESDMCNDIAKAGKCTSSAQHKHASYCKRSCGLCNVEAKPHPECRFPQPYRGDWLLFHDARKETVTIEDEFINISHLGHFICKSKSYNPNSYDPVKTYKLLSTYSNGCRPRYSCMEISQPSKKIIQFKLSRSSSTDISFHMFDFGEKSNLYNAVNSNIHNVLIPRNEMIWGQCGIDGALTVNATWYEEGSIEGQTPDQPSYCNGVLSDWDSKACSTKNTITLSLHACPTHQRWNKHSTDLEYLCIGYYDIGKDMSLLITQAVTNDHQYRCWLIRRYPGQASHKPWKIGIQFNSAQCPPSRNIETLLMGNYHMALHTHKNMVSNICEENLSPSRSSEGDTPHGGVTSQAVNSPRTPLKFSIWHSVETVSKSPGSSYPHQIAGARLAESAAEALGACVSHLPLIFSLTFVHFLAIYSHL